jgi:hypothetical protein
VGSSINCGYGVLMLCRQQSISVLASPTIKILSEDAEKESQKVRSMYEQGSSPLWENGQHLSRTQTVNTGPASDDPFMYVL